MDWIAQQNLSEKARVKNTLSHNVKAPFLPTPSRMRHATNSADTCPGRTGELSHSGLSLVPFNSRQNGLLAARSKIVCRSTVSMSTSEEELDAWLTRIPVIDLLSQNTTWESLQKATVMSGLQLSCSDVLNILKQAEDLANRSSGDMPPAMTEDRMLCSSIASMCCLVLMREVDDMDVRQAAQALSCLGTLTAKGYLPDSGKDMQRELVVASAHLVHRVRLACVQDPEGAVSPALMPGVLLGAALLSPQFMDAQFLQEAERLLAEDRVMQELPPASVAALMSAFTIVRRGRLRSWRPSSVWLSQLQSTIADRLHLFTPSQVAATVHGLVELTTSSNACVFDHGPKKQNRKSRDASASRSSSSDLDHLGPSSGNMASALGSTASGNSIDEEILSAVRRRVAQLQRRVDGGALPAMLPDLVQRVVDWEHAYWQTTGTLRNNTVNADDDADVRSQASELVLDHSSSGSGPAVMSSSDLALLLMSYTRMGVPGFTHSRPARLGALPLEVLMAQQELAAQGRWIPPTTPLQDGDTDDDVILDDTYEEED